MKTFVEVDESTFHHLAMRNALIREYLRFLSTGDNDTAFALLQEIKNDFDREKAEREQGAVLDE